MAEAPHIAAEGDSNTPVAGTSADTTPQPQKPPPPVASATDGPQERKAREYMEQAEKKIKSAQSFFGGLFGQTIPVSTPHYKRDKAGFGVDNNFTDSDEDKRLLSKGKSGAAKLEDAADLFVRAANSFKVAKRNKAAGDAFRRAAELHMGMETKHEAATHFVEAGLVLKREDPKEAVQCYQRAIEIYTDMGRFSLAARYHSTVAEIYETELLDFEEAISNYERAADYHRGEDAVGSSNKCLVKVAHMCAMLQQFDKAASLFEEIGKNSLENTLLKYGAKDYFFKAAICHFCISAEAAKDAIERYKQIHPGFDGTRELKLIQDLLEAHEEEDTDKFADIVKDYDAISRIDQWLTAQLLHIKKSIHAVPDIN